MSFSVIPETLKKLMKFLRKHSIGATFYEKQGMLRAFKNLIDEENNDQNTIELIEKVAKIL